MALVYFLVGKGGRCVRLTTLPPSCAVVMKSENLNSWNPLGYSRPVMGLLFVTGVQERVNTLLHMRKVLVHNSMRISGKPNEVIHIFCRCPDESWGYCLRIGDSCLGPYNFRFIIIIHPMHGTYPSNSVFKYTIN
jgi:hypothetical protein